MKRKINIPNKIKEIKKDYNCLLDSFEKSEEIRKGQKELINALRAEVNKLRKRKNGEEETEYSQKGKTTRNKKKKAEIKSTTRRKSKKVRKGNKA